MRALRGGGCLAVLLLALGFTARAEARFVLSDPSSNVYSTLAVAAGERLELEAGAQVVGSIHSNGGADLQTGSSIQGNASTAGTLKGGGIVSGTVTQGAAPRLLPAVPVEATARSWADRIFEGDTTFDGPQAVDDVIFVRGNVRFRAGVEGIGTVIASGDILFDNITDGHPGTLGPNTRLSLIAFHDILVGKQRLLRGVLLAGRDIVFDREGGFEGVAVARRQAWLHQGCRLTFVGIDQEAPVISGFVPANGALIATATPEVRASFTDDSSGVDPAAVRLTLDDVDVTGQATVSSTGLLYRATLADGSHVVVVTVRDRSGKQSVAFWRFVVDATPPELSILSPGARVTSSTARLGISLAVNDATSGLDWAASSARVDSADLLLSTCGLDPGAAQCGFSPLATGSHRLTVILRDKAGNQATASRDFEFLLDQEPPVVSVQGVQDGAVVRTPTLPISGTVSDASGVRSVTVNGRETVVDGGRFQAQVDLDEGINGISVDAYDVFGYATYFEAKVQLDTSPPSLKVESPISGQIINRPEIRLAGVSRDETGLAVLEVNGVPIPSTDGMFDMDVPLAEGANRLVVRAVDRAGNERQAAFDVFRYTLPVVAITAPDDLAFLAATAVEVRGTVSEPAASVSVNGVPAVVSGTTFVAADVPLIEGGNIVTAVAKNPAGRVGTDTINVVRDLFPPRLAVELPRDGSTVYEPQIAVSGLVNDIVAGTVNASQATVTVNGRQATVSNRSFWIGGVPLVPGENVLTVAAVDASGNAGQVSVRVFRAEPGGVARIVAVSGDRQAQAIGQPLAAPLVVELRDGAGQPVAGRPVVFKVRGGDGVLGGGRRQIAVTTDSAGRAAATFTLGMRAGAGNQRVEASSAGFQGPAVFTVDAGLGEPSQLLVDSGDQQVGVAGQALPRPFVAVVTDAGFNRIEGMLVKWTVARGRGHFENGQQEILSLSDSDGRVIVPFVLDPDEGIANHVVEARIAGVEESPTIAFVASGRAAGPDLAATAVSGVVLDNTNTPVSGATLRILDTSLTARTDAQGQFRIAGAPVGTIRLVVDGSTVERPGSWPDLEFVVTTVPGRDNPLTLPVYLLPLDLAHGVSVDETHGGTLRLSEVPGFALEIAPGSVTFPGGSRSGMVSVTVVHSDKIPMVPNFGQQPTLIVTIQPAGARFDPPARLTLPNVEGLRPGEVTELYSFDHDLGHFVSIGPATVSEDGSAIVANPGVGILKAGWHCGGNPSVTGTPHACPACQICNGSQCVPGCALPQSFTLPAPAGISRVAAAAGTCECEPCSVGNSCSGGCRPREAGSVTALADSRADGVSKAKGKSIAFSPSGLNLPGCSQVRYEWDFGDGKTSTSAVTGHAFDAPGTYKVILRIRCGACDKVLAQDDVTVNVIGLTIRVISGATHQHVIGAQNWAAIKGQGNVQLEAVITPSDPEAAKRIQWTGATPDPKDPARATVEKPQAVRRTVVAKVDDLSDTVDLWILWVELEARTSGTLSPTNNVLPLPGDGFPSLGPMSDEGVSGFTRAEAAGNIEIVGHLKPEGVNQVVEKEGWRLERWVDLTRCANGVILQQSMSDNSFDVWMDLDPEEDDNIYDVDGPTAGINFNVLHTVEAYLSFRQWATWNGEKASDDLFWHYQARVDDDLDAANKPMNRDTLLNDVGPGPLSVPQTCFFKLRV